MKRIFIILSILSVLCCCQDSFAITKAKSSHQTEKLEYDVYYHWGIIWKKAGHGTLSLNEEIAQDGSNRLHGKLTGKTLSIIEYVMAVRDTLDCWYTPNFVPIEYCKKTNEGSYKAIERNYYTSYKKGDKPEDVDSTKVEIRRWRNKKGSDSKTHVCKGPAYDMLSIFYVFRQLDFANLKTGTKLKFPIFSGVNMQYMFVEYQGKTTCELKNGKKYPAYRVELTFNTKGEDSTPLHVWLSTGPDHRPLNVIIQLKRIGSIQGEIVEK